MGIFGETRLGSEIIKNEKAFFIPPTDSLVITNESKAESCFLIARENQLGSK